jgi:hypothetical protein
MTRFEDMDPDDETRLLQYEIKKALALSESSSRPMGALYKQASRVGPNGYTALGEHFVDAIFAQETPRPVISRLITDLVLSVHDEKGEAFPREGSMSHATPFMNVLVRETPKTIVDWAEDLAEDHAPLTIVSGTVFAAFFDQRDACANVHRREGKRYRTVRPSFWDMAAASDRFPLSIFSTPCASADGIIFSSNRRFVIGAILAHAFEPTMRRIAAHIATHATQKFVWTRIVDDNEQKGEERYKDVLVEATDQERLMVLKDLHGSVDAPQSRRALVAAALGIAF